MLEWIEGVVIGLSLCPFARHAMDSGAVRTVLADGDLESVLTALAAEMDRLAAQDTGSAATTLLLLCDEHGDSRIAADFDDYLDLVALAQDLLDALGYGGELQMATFHPQYVFDDAPPDDPANLSNRSPVPVIHLLLEDAVTAAVAHHSNAEGIPERNVALLRRLGTEAILARASAAVQARSRDD